MQIGQKKYSKWNQYDVLIDQKLLNNIKEFVPADNSGKFNAKSFRLTKNGQATGVFNILNEQNNNVINQIAEENQ